MGHSGSSGTEGQPRHPCLVFCAALVPTTRAGPSRTQVHPSSGVLFSAKIWSRILCNVVKRFSFSRKISNSNYTDHKKRFTWIKSLFGMPAYRRHCSRKHQSRGITPQHWWRNTHSSSLRFRNLRKTFSSTA